MPSVTREASERPLSYALVTPARNEEANLRRLAESLLNQTLAPTAWVIVDTGSSDGTLELARDLGRANPWIRGVEGWSGPAARSGGKPQRIDADTIVVRAFNTGLELLEGPVDVVVKLDADVSMKPTYFEQLVGAFAEDEQLGIASGGCLEQKDGEWRVVHVTGNHVRGASHAYRWACLQDVLPLVERSGWDSLDELKAEVLGWRVRTLPEIFFYHHRYVGQRDGRPWARWVRQGRTAHYMGYRFSYLCTRALYRSVSHPAAVTMIWGYLSAALSGEPVYADESVRRHLRRQQSPLQLRTRALEALGRRGG